MITRDLDVTGADFQTEVTVRFRAIRKEVVSSMYNNIWDLQLKKLWAEIRFPNLNGLVHLPFSVHCKSA